MRKLPLFLLLIVCILIPSCNLEPVSEQDESINNYIYPYLDFELSENSTYYIATVVSGANFESIAVPGNIHTDYGVSMPVKFGGFEDPEDAKSLRELYLDEAVEGMEEGALIHATNIEKIIHQGAENDMHWPYLPILEAEGVHFGGWKAGDEFIWEVTAEGYVQRTFDIDKNNSEAIPVFFELKYMEAKSPSCTEPGSVEYYYCEHCGKKYADKAGTTLLDDVSLSVIGHSLIHHDGIEPTCLAEGNVEYWHCDSCEKLFSDEGATNEIESVILPKVDHKSNNEWQKDNSEYHYYKCIWCSTELNIENHDWEEEIIQVPTDLIDGVKRYTCIICGYSKDENISTHEHKIGEDGKCYEATCTTGAYCEGTCTECGQTVKIYSSEKLGHDYSEVPYVAPTCTEKGVIKHFHCNGCGENFENESTETPLESTEIAALGHSFATEWSSDDSTHYHKCTRCDEKADVAEHLYDQEEEKCQKSPATCTEGAVYYKTCVCGKCSTNAKDTFQTEPLGHNYTNEDGTDNYKHDNSGHWIECTRCSVEKEGSRAEHTFENDEDSAYIICTSCDYKKRVPQGGFNPDIQDAYPAGSMVQVSNEGTVFTFKVKNENEDYPITSYKWETSGVAISADNADTFVFDAPNLKTYWVRCTFSNGNGSASLSVTVRGGNRSSSGQ